MTTLRLLGAALFAMALSATTTAFAEQNDDWETVRSALDDAQQHQQTWQRGWAAFFGTSAAVSLYLGTSASDSEDRYDARVRTVTSTLGLGDTLVNPPPHADAYQEFQQIRRSSYETDAGLEETATMLEALRQEEQERAGWRGRIGAALVNFGAYLAIGVGDGRPGDGAQVAGIGLLVNEIKVRTEPQAGDDARRLPLGNASVEVHPQVFATTNGMGIRVDF